MVRPGRHIALLLLRFTRIRAHVPTYGTGTDNCFTPTHAHTVSQVVYLKGTGGLQIHIESHSKPFDISRGEMLDINAVFKHEYDQTTYDLFVGCGTCASGADPLTKWPAMTPNQVALSGYGPGEVEPFTQTAHRSVFPPEQRQYNSSLLGDCSHAGPDQYFSIQVRDHNNRTGEGHATLVWGAVIGIREAFTAEELISFPLYVLRNHGDTWNGLGWTWWVVLPGTLLGIWTGRYLVSLWSGRKFLNPFDRQMIYEPRAWLCEFAIVSFLAVMLEMTVHLIYAQAHAAHDGAFWLGLLVVAGLSNGVPALTQSLIFRGLYHRDEGGALASSRWWPLELVLGVSWLFLFGAGFYIGPALVVLDALLRAYEDFGTRRAVRVAPSTTAVGYRPPYERGDLSLLTLSSTRARPLRAA